MSSYCCDCNQYKCRCKTMSIQDVLRDIDCRLDELERQICKNMEIVTSVEVPFEVDGSVDGAIMTVTGDVGYTVYAYQPKLCTVNNNCSSPYDSMYNGWGEPISSTSNNTNGIVISPIGTTPVVSNTPLVSRLNGITEIILENVTITRPVIGGVDPVPPVDFIIGRVPPIARPVENRSTVLYNRTTSINHLGFPNDSTTNSIGNIIDRIDLIIATTGRIILRITFRIPQVAPLHASYTSTVGLSVRYSINQQSTVTV